MSGTDIAYHAIIECYTMSGTEIAYAEPTFWRAKPRTQYNMPRSRALAAYGPATRCSRMERQDLTETLEREREERKVHTAIGLRTCYAMSGTDTAYHAIIACSAMSGTDVPHHATVLHDVKEELVLTSLITLHTAIGLRTCYAISGTDIAYHATRRRESKQRRQRRSLTYSW
eukprot:2391034-Rhodomonas_salina.3